MMRDENENETLCSNATKDEDDERRMTRGGEKEKNKSLNGLWRQAEEQG